MSTPTRLELWQTEWCPASRRVRQRLTELGLSYTAHQVPVDPAQRDALAERSGQRSIPVLSDDDTVVVGEDPIVEHLNRYYDEPREARAHQEKAARARRRELEEACRELTPATH